MRITKRDIALVIALGLGIAQLVFIGSDRPVETKQVCTMVYDDADHEARPAGSAYVDGAWYGSDGLIIGYSMTEDSIITREPDCPAERH